MTYRSFRKGTRVYWLDATDGDWCSLSRGKVRSGVVAKRVTGERNWGVRGVGEVKGYEIASKGTRIYKSKNRLTTSRASILRFKAQAARACKQR